MLEYELNGKIYTEEDLIKAAGGKDKLQAYIKSKGFKPASKKTKQPAKLDERFGEDIYKKTFGFENPAKDQFSEINKTKKKKSVVKEEGWKLDKRGYKVPLSYEEPSTFDNVIDKITNFFKSEPENNGKLTEYDPGPIEEQRKKYIQDQKDALNGTGNYSFLKNVPKEERIIYAEKVAAPTYTKLQWDQQKGVNKVVPSQEAIDYVSKDIDLKKYNNTLSLNQDIGKKINELALNDPRLKFQQDLAKKNAAPLIKQKLNEIKKTYKLNTQEDVNKAEKDLQNYAIKTINDFLSKQPGFQELNDEFSTIENALSNSLTKQWGRQQSGTLSFFDTLQKGGEELQKSSNPLKKSVGWIAEMGGALAEGGAKGIKQLSTSIKQAKVSAKHGDIIELNKFYNKYKNRNDNEKFDLRNEWAQMMGGVEGTGPFGLVKIPKTFGEAKAKVEESINKLNTDISEQVKGIEKNKQFLGLFNQSDLTNGVDAKDIFALVGEQTPNLTITAAGSVTRNPYITGLGIASMFTQTYGDMYYSAVEAGLKRDLGREPNQKEISNAIAKGEYANRGEAAAWAAVSSAAEFASELNIIKNTGKSLGLGNTGREVMGSLLRGEIKTVAKSLANKGINMGSSAFGEYLTEGFQTGIEQASLGTQIGDDATRYINPTEMSNAADAGGLIGFVFPFAGTVASQTMPELRASAVKVASRFNISTNAVQVDNFFKEAAKNIQNKFTAGEITDTQKASELETLSTIRSSSNKVPSNFSSDAKKKAIDLILEKANLEKETAGKDKDLVAPELEQIKKINLDLALLAYSEKQRINTEKNSEKIGTSIEQIGTIVDKEGNKVFKGALGKGKAIEVFETEDDAQAAYDEWFKNDIESSKKDLQTSFDAGEIDQDTYNKEVEALDNSSPQDIRKTDGFVLKNGQILVNKERAAKVGALNVAPHELLHNILKSEFSDSARKIELKDQFLSILSKSERRKLDARILAVDENGERLYSDEDLQDSPDEYITQYFELLAKGDIKWSDNIKETLINIWDNILKPIFVKKGFTNIEFKDGRDIYNFVKDYAKTVKKGKISERASSLLKAGEDISGVTKFSKTSNELKAELENIKENEMDYDPDDFDQQVRNLEGKIKKAIEKEKAGITPVTKKEITEEDIDKEIIKNEKGSVSSDKVQKIYEEKGIDGAQDIIDLFKPITKKLVNKRMDAPGFDRDLLTSEIETGDGGILYLIRSYKPEKGAPLAAYINKQLPLRAIAASRRVLDKDFSKDVTEEKGLIAEETVSETKEKPKYKNALESNVFDSEVLKTLSNKIVTITRTLKNRIDAPVTLNRTVTPLISEIRDEVGRLLDIDVKTAMGGKKDDQLKKWLLKNKRYILENMTTTWLMGKDGVGGMPQAIQKQIDGKWVNYPDWVGKKIDREKTTTDQAGRTSGAELVRRLPNVNNNVSNEVYLAQVLEPSGNPIRGRKESLAKAVAEESAFDIINNDLENEGPIFEALSTNQQRLGAEVTNAFAVEIARQSERGNIKFSKTGVNAVDKIGTEFYNFYKDLDTNNKALVFNYLDNKEFKGINNNIKNELDNILNRWETAYINNSDKILNKINIERRKKFKEEYPKVESFNKYFEKEKEDIRVSKTALLGLSKTGLNFIENNKDTINEINSYVFENLKYQVENAKNENEKIKLINSFLRTYRAVFTGGDYGKFFGGSNTNLLKKLNDIKEFDKLGYSLKTIGTNNIIIDKNGINPTYVENQSTKADDIKNIIEKGIDNLNINRIKQSDLALNDILNFADFIKNSSMSPKAKAMAIILMKSSTYSPLRVMGKVDSIILDKNNRNVDGYTWEHVIPADEIVRHIMSYALDLPFANNTITTKENLKLLLEDSKISLLPNNINNILNTILKSQMPSSWKIGDNAYNARYFNENVLEVLRTNGIDLIETDLIKLNGNGETIKDELIIDFEARKNALNIKNSQEATIKSLKPSKTPKGISVFDFDDTVGLTKGSVLYTMPDGSKGKLNAEEFAKNGSTLLAEGAVFDFSEFSKVVDGKPGPMVEKMKKMIGKFGPDNFFILTARPPDAAGPIHEFLSSIGINIPLENITGLGNSTAQAKADWMTAKAAEGYNDFYFADDAPQNVEAVKKALEVPGITSKVQQARLKFSLTSKQDLKWKQGDEDLSTKFTVGNIDYRISMIETAYMEYDDDVQKTLFDLVEKNGLDEETTIAAYDGEAYNLEFWDKKKGNGITGSGNAAEVFGIVINGVADKVKKKNIEALVFTAKEPSRIKLYNSMAEVVANKLGWGAYYKDGVYILAKKPKTIGAATGVGSLKPVQDVLKVVDIKSPIQQNKIKFSKTMSDDFNRIIEENKGVESYKVFSDITARRKGLKKNKFDFYVPPSAADFELLLYKFMGKGALGEEQKKFFQDALITPYINGVDLMDAVRQSIKKEYKALLKSFPNIRKELEKLTPNKNFTYDQAIRVAIWNQYGTEIPGLSQRDTIYLTDLINNDPDLAAFKDGLIVMGRQKDGWLPPSTYWDSDTIVSDLYNITEGSGRKKFLGEFIENTENIFGKWEDGRLVGPNMNKVEAVYGTNVREALEDSIYRMINGKNRSYGQDKETAAWSSWVNGSTGAIMFMNTRSAALQMLGAVNFLNWRDNNPYNAGKAFLNQPQYWKDFAHIWNSDKLKERRGGLREDVASAEIANAAAGSKNKVVAVTSYLLKIGYTPTQLADSFAIASGGAPFYRNRINSYIKEGLTEQEAEKKAWQDFSKVSDETQQSGDPKDISKQQSSGAGRLLLVFQNFTMQQSRIVKKAVLDLKNGRGDAKTNIAKIAYYLAVQNIMFSTLQQGLFAVMFDDDDEEDKKKKAQKKTKTDAAIEVANGVLDSILRGTGFIGGAAATLKNTIVKYFEEEAKKQKAEYAKVVLEVANMSPPIGSKLRKTYSALQQTKYDKDLIKERGWGVMQDGRVHLGPMYSVTGKLVEVGTNFPMDRLVNKVENVSQAFNSENTAMQRIATAAGYSPWTVGIEGTKGDIKIKEEAKAKRKEEGLIKAKETRRENAERLKDSIRSLSIPEQRAYRRKIALEKREKRREKALEKREERRKKLEMFKKLNANK